MDKVLFHLRSYARQVALQTGVPRFYRDYTHEVQQSIQHLFNDLALIRLKTFVSEVCADDFGHGRRHIMLVTRDTGALVFAMARTSDMSETHVRKTVRCGQAAGLLHDIRRKEPRHAAKGAETARRILRHFPSFEGAEIEEIAQAIANHEAFCEPQRLQTTTGQLISDCLYDADKFRWGPDNFTDMVWSMAAFFGIPLEGIVSAYERGIEAIARIKTSFRTELGKRYGPEIINMGLRIGEQLMAYIRSEILPKERC